MAKKLLSLVFILVVSMMGSRVWARVTGLCSNCHTMHNSQNGQPVDENGPRIYLLDPVSTFTDACVACHSAEDSTTIVVEGSTRIPIVLNLQEPTYPSDGSSSGTLAGGNFYWLYANAGVGGENQSVYGHNVLAIDGVPADENLSQAPGKPDMASGPNCARCHDRIERCESCHTPAHHADDSGP
ncbi:MAG TPA: hypothetical protein ENJ96_09875, partial [Thermodesulfatator atlanticus]|nr:hypothetical protein [Thermodesulfatator atlanticus]